MNQSVCHGAELRCSCGSLPGLLQLAGGGTSTATVQALATVLDHRPLVQIPAFGSCLCAGHPLAATAFAPPPCVPQTAQPWTQPHATPRLGAAPLLTADATLRCAYGGEIQCTAAGQQGLQVIR